LWAEHQAKWRALVDEHPLRYLFLEVTRRCNLACAYCGSDCRPQAPRDELTVAQWLQVVRDVARDFDPRKIMVAVTGGEPLLKEDVDLLLHELRRLGFGFGLVTNGYYLDAERARRLVDAGVGSISISMDAPTELNDRLRGKGASAKVRAAVEALQAAGFAGELEIISTITRPVVPLLEAMRAHVAGLRVPNWRVAPVMPIGRAAQRPDLVPDARDVRTMLEFVRAARRDGFTPAPEFSEEGFLGNRFEGCVRPYLAQCRAGITIAGIRSDGRIGACPELGDAFLQGDIRTESLQTVWQTRYANLRDRAWTKRGRCDGCVQYDRCQGGSLHLYAAPGADLARCLYWMARETDPDGGAGP
jgi:radical SAM protein with 4Fe4S-binding SPASM domain